jgi:hypothetical protein
MKRIIVLMTVAGSFAFANSGEDLIKTKCATCHTLEIPQMEMMPDFVAPPMDAVMFHMKDVITGKDNLKAFIDDYVFDPDVSKSVCESNKVQKFGVMPSQKGKVTKEELAVISDYMIDTYPREEFVNHLMEMLKNDQMTALKASPFLINSEYLPHFTKLLIEHWDKAKLGLTAEQKEKLLVVRKNTVMGVKKIKKQTTFLEFEIAETMIAREAVETVQTQLDELADIKKEATVIHLKCISDTTAILSDEQVGYLLPMWQ